MLNIIIKIGEHFIKVADFIYRAQTMYIKYRQYVETLEYIQTICFIIQCCEYTYSKASAVAFCWQLLLANDFRRNINLLCSEWTTESLCHVTCNKLAVTTRMATWDRRLHVCPYGTNG